MNRTLQIISSELSINTQCNSHSMYKLSINNAIENHLHLISIRDAKEKWRRLCKKAIKEKQKQIKNDVSTESKGINFFLRH